jgi:hypothetical protein
VISSSRYLGARLSSTSSRAVEELDRVVEHPAAEREELAHLVHVLIFPPVRSIAVSIDESMNPLIP